jgi:hypothetical protein
MGGKRTVLVLSISVVSTLGGAGVASAKPPWTPVEGTPAPVTCSDRSPGPIPGNGIADPGPGGGQMIHPCGPR